MYAGSMLPFLFAWTLGCAGSPTEALSWREQWELFVLTEDGSLIEGRVAVGNTGLYRGQGHFRANRWMDGTTPIQFSMDGGPADVDVGDDHASVRVGSALLGQYEAGPHWTLRLAHEEANAIIHVDPGGPAVPMVTEINAWGQWTAAAPIAHGSAHGWFTAGRRGGKFEGRAIALHRGGDGVIGQTRTAIAVVAEGVSIGLDAQGESQLAWARIGDREAALSSLALTAGPGRSQVLDFRPDSDLVVTVEPTAVGGESNGYETLFGWERAAALASGLIANRSVHRARATVAFEGETFTAAAVVLNVD